MPSPHDPNLQGETAEISSDKLRSVLDYLDKEMTLEGSACLISGAVAAWTMKEVLFDDKATKLFTPTGRMLLILGCGLLLFAAVFFFLQRSRLANQYWHIARSNALPQSRLSGCVGNLIAGLDLVRWWWAYYIARLSMTIAFLSFSFAFLYAVGDPNKSTPIYPVTLSLQNLSCTSQDMKTFTCYFK